MTAQVLPARPVPGRADACEAWLYAAEKLVCVLCLAVMLFAVAGGVVIRFWGLPLPNISEWALVAMSPLTFVGAALCTRVQAHIAVDVIKQVPWAGVQRAARLLVALCMVVFSVVYSWLGWTLFEDTLLTGEKLLDMGTPLAVPVFFLLLGMVCMAIHSVLECWRAVRGLPPCQEDA